MAASANWTYAVFNHTSAQPTMNPERQPRAAEDTWRWTRHFQRQENLHHGNIN